MKVKMNEVVKSVPAMPFSSGTDYGVFKFNFCNRCKNHKVREDGFPALTEDGGCPIENAMEDARYDLKLFPNDSIRRLMDKDDNVVRFHFCESYEEIPKFNELKAYKDTGLSPEVCMNYKKFEDECISEGVTFKNILTLMNIAKGMTCDECRNRKHCAIHDNFNIRYCSNFARATELIVAEDKLREILEKKGNQYIKI